MQPYDDYGHAGRPTTDANPVGLAGFIVSLVSLVACGGLISPLGLILSLVGCFRQPRGLAIAGVILGLIGSTGFILVIVLLGVGLVAAAIGLVFGASFIGQTLETGFDANEIRQAIVAFEREEGRLPTSIDELTDLGEHTTLDLWDVPYVLEIDADERTMTLISLGEDQTLDTDDDIRITLPIVSIDSDREVAPLESESPPPSADGESAAEAPAGG